MINRNRTHRSALPRGFTVIEMIAVIVILGTLAGVITPMIVNASASYASASQQRESVGGLNYALERVSRLFHEMPPKSDGKTNISKALPSKVEFGDGSGGPGSGSKVELIGTTLWYTAVGQSAQPLAQNISQFTITYFEQDGVKNSSANPDKTQRVNITIASNGVELRSTVYLRESNAMKVDGDGDGDGDGDDD